MKGILMSTSAVLALATALPAFAQAPAAPGDDVGIAEIVVTAQRREETLQRSPVTVTAVGSDTLSKQNVKEFSNLASVLPNTQVAVTGGARVQIAVRGIRNNDFSPGAESPVAVHIDGSYIPRMTGLAGLFYDIARVESLPGPQGTLYGRNAAAGAINIITNQPAFERQAAAELEAGNYALFRGFGMVNVPLSDEVAVRAAFQRYKHNAYNKAGGDDADQTSGRLSALWRHDKLRLAASVDYTEIGGHGTIDNDLNAQDPYDSRAIYSIASTRLAGLDIKQLGIQLKADYDLDFATLTAQVSQRNSVEKSGTRGNDEFSYFNFKSRANIGEVRLTSNSTTPLQWVVGAFGFDEKQPSYGIVGANSDNPFGAGGTCDALNATPNIPACGNYLPELGLRTKSYAFFGQATYSPIETLHITGGLRYSHDKKNYNGKYLCQVGGNGEFFQFSPCQNAAIPLDRGSPASWESTDYKIGVSYDVNPNSLLYANTSSGYRAGGSFISPFNPTYGPESITNYEIGWKNSFFNRRLIVNADAYRQNYEDFIYTYNVIGDIVPVPGVLVPFSISQADNLGKVKITGADLTVAWLATPDDLFNFGVEYIHTKVGRATLRCTAAAPTDNGPCAATAGFVNPTGKALPNTPEWRLTASYEHTFRLDGGATVVPRAQIHAESGRWMDFSHLAGTRQDAFTQTDLSLTYTSSDKTWNVGAWVQNLEDKAVFLNAGASNGAHPREYPSGIAAVYRAPRTFGVKVGAQF